VIIPSPVPNLRTVSTIVCVHGAFHELWGPHQIASRWVPALRDGLALADADVDPADVEIVFYGELFRSDPAAPISDDELRAIARRTGIAALASRIAGGDDGVPSLIEQLGRDRVRRAVGQLGRYFDDPSLRDRVRDRVAASIGPDTAVVVAHSLGTIVTYEALATLPGPPRLDLVTIGCPLGYPEVVEADMRPAVVDGHAERPACVRRWTNVAARGDIVAAHPLTPVFADVEEHTVDNGHRPHDAPPYLCSLATGRAVATALGVGPG
jgi:pimeloyl-ACP methyl ester carboxylesterase